MQTHNPMTKRKPKHQLENTQTPKHDTTMGFFKEHYSFLQVSHTQYHVILLSTDKNSWPQKAPSALQNGRPQARTWGSQILHTLKKQWVWEFPASHIYLCLTVPKPLTVWITINYGKFWKRWEYQTTWPASLETCMQVRKQQLKLDMEQQTGSK